MIATSRLDLAFQGSLTLDEAKALIVSRGFRVSAASWEDSEHVHAFSVESHGPASCGHPVMSVHDNKVTGWVYTN